MLNRFGLHLPQGGHASGPESIARVAVLAESLGFDDLWVSDHVVVPSTQNYPTPYMYDPLLTLTYAAAVTTTIGLGTAVLVLPQYHPVQLANSLASLDALSSGRLRLGVGVGWSAAEFETLDQNFTDRGRRTDEIIELLRTAWTNDPVDFDGNFYTMRSIRLLPKPAHTIPIWVGGKSEAACRRACRLGDGYQSLGLSVEEAPGVVQRIRRDRPEESFTISLRTGWDAVAMDHDLIRSELAAFSAAGIQHLVATPWQRDIDSFVAAVEQLADILGLTGRRNHG